ncbi:DUF4261 domain-containing protein [Bradyrhizobium sp. CCGE-LA001]|uniref:DUF4261 domain-containing protein n=1 Tax=Bradyrhizobium sp. CCGE-LA001 TaxID=1223566 RepID=UPI000745AEB2|nr:DUF4261 domain-containing protein [Bradyrhizobium sp. CCGE-LA001]AMA59374.1 hypothetical protein BCCGELA001_25950 [Bradyrhizobium sp. CCGE-LA001]
MSKLSLGFVLLDSPVTPDMSAVANILRARHPDLMTGPDDPGEQHVQASSPLIRCGNQLVAVMSMPAPLPDDTGLWSRAATNWPESKAVAVRHRGHLIVSALGKDVPPLTAARTTTSVIGALIAAMPESCGVVWDGRVARPSGLWLESSSRAFAPFPDYPFTLWVDILPFRSDRKIGAITVGLSSFVGREIEFRSARLTLPTVIDKVAGLSAYLIEHGNVVKDGDTIGASAEERIKVRHRNSEVFGDLPVFFCSDDLAGSLQ